MSGHIGVPEARAARGALEIDPRIPAVVPGFDRPYFLAGLAGYSDGAMRLIARQLGSPFCVTESMRADAIVQGGVPLAQADPAAGFAADPAQAREPLRADQPLAGQLIGADPKAMAIAAGRLGELSYQVIDVNLACPCKKSRRQRPDGGSLLARPAEAIDVLRAVRDAVPRHLPTTVKLRRAYDESPAMRRAFDEIFEAAYDLGYQWANVHGRTVVQGYRGPSDLAFLASLTRRYPDRVILGSGDVFGAADVVHLRECTGVHAVAVARGAIGNPWIFSELAALARGETPSAPTVEEQGTVLLQHFELAKRLRGERLAGRLMRKFGIHVSSRHPRSESVKTAFIACRRPSDFVSVIAEYYSAM